MAVEKATISFMLLIIDRLQKQLRFIFVEPSTAITLLSYVVLTQLVKMWLLRRKWI